MAKEEKKKEEKKKARYMYNMASSSLELEGKVYRLGDELELDEEQAHRLRFQIKPAE